MSFHELVRQNFAGGGECQLTPIGFDQFLRSFGRGYEDLRGIEAVQLGGDVDRNGVRSPVIIVRPLSPAAS